uniref:Uncharacterized protein n=1 Tax=Astyanax mexicanus TaxID=7994 RepID=A0A3B1JK50_ASTMX
RFKLKNLYTSNKCWRVCGLVGDHTHIFWNCPLLLAYWKNIQNEINKCLNIEFVPLSLKKYYYKIILLLMKALSGCFGDIEFACSESGYFF